MFQRSKAVIASQAFNSATVDLETVRETLLYMHADCADEPRLARVAAALMDALVEIETVAPAGAMAVEPAIAAARFLPASLA